MKAGPVRQFFLTFFILISCVAQLSFAQTFKQVYEIHDLMRDTKVKETWEIIRNEKYEGQYITLRTTHTDEQLSTIEHTLISNYWWKRKLKTNSETAYYEEFLAIPPTDLEIGDSTFGYVYVHDSRSEEVKESWPMFVSIESYKGALLSRTTLYISNDRVMVVTRVYTKKNYFTPFIHEIKIFKPGIDPKSVPSVGKREDYLETHIITSML